MPKVVGVRFKPSTKVYYFDPGNLELREGDRVIVETARARELGKVVLPVKEVPTEEVVGQLKSVVRLATEADQAEADRNASRQVETMNKCREKAVEHGLPIKIIAVEYNFDGSCLVVFFTSEQRVDFRALVKDLARMFRARIEMRQVGVRDEAKLLQGIGPCGRALCCATHLCEFVPVSIKMAKLQNLPLSPMEISGLCGRLLCCLTYENEHYLEVQSRMPRLGTIVQTENGPGRVKGYNLIKESLRVELEGGTLVEVPLDASEVNSQESRERRAAR